MTDLSSLLRELEAVLRNGDAVIAQHFAPAAPANEVKSCLNDIGVESPPELLAWFGWHNGLGSEMTGRPLRFAELVPGAEFYDVVRLRDEYRSARRIAIELANHPQMIWCADELWDPMWLPLLRLFGKGFVVIDAQSRPTSPVHIMWHDDDHDDRLRVVWPSVASFVHFAVEQFHAGVYVVGTDGAVDGPTLDRPGR